MEDRCRSESQLLCCGRSGKVLAGHCKPEPEVILPYMRISAFPGAADGLACKTSAVSADASKGMHVIAKRLRRGTPPHGVRHQRKKGDEARLIPVSYIMLLRSLRHVTYRFINTHIDWCERRCGVVLCRTCRYQVSSSEPTAGRM
jgi:hypothetical protein